MTKTVDPDFLRQLEGWSLATAEIFYRMPDAKSVLQTYVWQDYDLAPKFPQLQKFLDFWERELEGPIHSVRVAHSRLLGPKELRMVGSEIALH
jgi:Usg protein, probable subunit of phosphoribosylanthranilate isomerase